MALIISPAARGFSRGTVSGRKGRLDLGDLSSNPIKAAGLQALVDSPYLQHIEQLSLYLLLPKKQEAALRKRLGDRLKD